MQTDDWRGEHLIRTPKKPEPQEILAPGSPAHSAAAVLARKADADIIRPLAKKHTRAEIHRMTGITTNRIYFICRTFKIAPMEPVSSPKKKPCTPAVATDIDLQDHADTPNENASEPSP